MRTETPDLIIAAHLRHLELLDRTPDSIYCRYRALARMTAALGIPLLEASPADLLAWRAGLSVGPATIVAYVSHAREFYRWAVVSGLLGENPAAGLPVPQLGRRLPRPISEDELQAAVLGAPPRIRPWLVLAGWAGLRAREIAYLRRECVLEHWHPPMLLIAFDATKGRSERIVPMSAFVLRELRAAGLPRAGWMFLRRDGRPGPNRPWTISHLANAWLHECGSYAVLHGLRHRFLTLIQQQRHDLRITQELAGHASPATTAIYTAVDQSDAAEVVEALPIPRHLKVVCE